MRAGLSTADSGTSFAGVDPEMETSASILQRVFGGGGGGGDHSDKRNTLFARNAQRKVSGASSDSSLSSVIVITVVIILLLLLLHVCYRSQECEFRLPASRDRDQ